VEGTSLEELRKDRDYYTEFSYLASCFSVCAQMTYTKKYFCTVVGLNNEMGLKVFPYISTSTSEFT
jgi:hypothetical protein